MPDSCPFGREAGEAGGRRDRALGSGLEARGLRLGGRALGYRDSRFELFNVFCSIVQDLQTFAEVCIISPKRYFSCFGGGGCLQIFLLFVVEFNPIQPLLKHLHDR